MSYKYKLNEMSKTASPEEAEKELGIPQSGFEVGKVTYSKDGDTKYRVTDIDSETGQISWQITNLPAFDKLLDDANELITTSRGVYTKTKSDEKFREFFEEAKTLRNKIRKHLRNEYPDEYKRIQMFGEGEVDEISLSGAAGAYNTPFAFRKKGSTPRIGALTKLGYKLVKKDKEDVNEGTCGYDRDVNGKKLKGPGGLGEGDTYEKMAAKGKKAGNLKQGTVRKRLGIKKGEKIPLSLINKELARMRKMDKDKDKKGVQLGDKNQKYYKALQLSKTLKTTTNVNEEKAITFRPGTLDDMELSTRILDKEGIKYKVNNYDLILSDDDYLVVLDYLKGRNNVNVNLSNSIINENSKNPGAILGPGPKAGPDGVTDNYYVKAYKYKLVPKTKDGTYVQKGSGLDVKKLF